jgi:hypothetical protein
MGEHASDSEGHYTAEDSIQGGVTEKDLEILCDHMRRRRGMTMSSRKLS